MSTSPSVPESLPICEKGDINPAIQQQIFVSLAEQSTEFIGICDMNFMPFFVNKAGLHIVGLDSLEQAMRTPVKEFFFPEDQDFIYEEFFPRVLSEGRAEVEIRFRHFKTRRPLWMMYNVFHVHDVEGNAIGLATVSRNISDRKIVEEQLRNSQADLNRAQSVGQIGSWRLDVRENILTWSPENHRLFGIPEGTPMSYETFLSCIHPHDREYVDDMWQAGLRGAPYDIEHRLIVNGKTKWVREKAELEFDNKGTLRGGFGTSQDITQRKQDEEALREADRRKNEFLAILAHELRNPLTPIRNAVAILKLDSSSNPNVRAAQNLIDRQLQHLVRLIDDLMDMSRITHGNLQLRQEHIPLTSTLQHAIDAARPQIEKAKQVMTIDLPQSPIYINADSVRMTQVFLNLLNNASKYTESGGHIELCAKRDGANAVVIITDNGIGIQPEFLPNLFDLFSQAPSPRTQGSEGLGVGLSLARVLTEMHGGTIEGQSDGAGKGSRFIVRIPALDEQRPDPHSDPDQQAIPGHSTALRILVVDDNPDITESLVMLLELNGHQVETAEDGNKAIEAGARYRPDVILLDIGMPNMDGHAACQYIRKEPWGKDIRIFALSGLGRAEDLRKSRESGFSDHLVKPFAPSKLLGLLAEQSPAKA